MTALIIVAFIFAVIIGSISWHHGCACVGEAKRFGITPLYSWIHYAAENLFK